MKKIYFVLLATIILLIGCNSDTNTEIPVNSTATPQENMSESIPEENTEIIEFHNIAFEVNPEYNITLEDEKVSVTFEERALMNIVSMDISDLSDEIKETIPNLAATSTASAYEKYEKSREVTSLNILGLPATQIEIEMESGDLSGITIVCCFRTEDIAFTINFTDATNQYLEEYDLLISTLKML